MSVWAIADLHLSFGIPNKKMDVFGSVWTNYTQTIENAWRASIKEKDLVLIAGDISWATKLEDAIPDLEWIHRLPGTKVLIKGNHDFWWHSLAKIKKILPPSCHLIQNDSFMWHDIAIAGTRLWDDPQLSFHNIIDFKEQENVKKLTEDDTSEEKEKIYVRELDRLEISLKSMSPSAKTRLVMTHYPPIGPYLEETRASQLLEKYHVDCCVFGHLHSVKPDLHLFGEKNGVRYFLTACDYLEKFQPLKIQSSVDFFGKSI
jgi:uncharacterized protein